MRFKIADISSFSDERLKEIFDNLDLSQREYINRKSEKQKRQSLCARALLQDLLSEVYNGDLKNLICQKDNGGLFIKGADSIFVSISHSNDVVSVCCSSKRVGIDIEKIHPVSEKLMKRVTGRICDIEDFFRIWTLKEAYLKAEESSLGEALGIDENYILENYATESFIADDYFVSIVSIK